MIPMGENRLLDDLLPGILDCIVLDKIIPKLEWKDFYTLSSVSYSWYDAIRSRRVFDSRVLSNSLEIFVACHTDQTIALYSMRENSWREFPGIADICGGQNKIPALSQCLSMDGKVYVLGGMIGSEVSNKVFVFDLAGQGHWEQCASMKQQRHNFGSAVMDGKIYVFGGTAQTYVYGGEVPSKLRSSEVYEPKEDTWSLIRDMPECRFGQYVIRVGEELFNYKRVFHGRVFLRPVEVYHPFKDEWRLVHSWNQLLGGLLFTVHGNVFSIEADYTGQLGSRSLDMRKYDIQGDSWIHVCSFSFHSLIPGDYVPLRPGARPDAVLAVDDELIAFVPCRQRKVCLLQSTGFGGQNQKISWKLRAITFKPVLEGENCYFAGEGYYFAQKL